MQHIFPSEIRMTSWYWKILEWHHLAFYLLQDTDTEVTLSDNIQILCDYLRVLLIYLKYVIEHPSVLNGVNTQCFWFFTRQFIKRVKMPNMIIWQFCVPLISHEHFIRMSSAPEISEALFRKLIWVSDNKINIWLHFQVTK